MPTNCSADCAEEFFPLYQDCTQPLRPSLALLLHRLEDYVVCRVCAATTRISLCLKPTLRCNCAGHRTIDRVYDTMGGKLDGRATAFARFEYTCALAPLKPLYAKVKALRTGPHKCKIDTSKIKATPTTAVSSPDLSGRRRTFGIRATMNRKCELSKFNGRLSEVANACCGNSTCTGSELVDCTYDCAQVAPSFVQVRHCPAQPPPPPSILLYSAAATRLANDTSTGQSSLRLSCCLGNGVPESVRRTCAELFPYARPHAWSWSGDKSAHAARKDLRENPEETGHRRDYK